jgi:carbon monoxide dehydrogenase subunit G
MELHAEHSYPAPPAAVFAMVTDPEYVKQRVEATGGRNVEVMVSGPADEPTVVSRWTLPADVPAFAKHFVGDTINVRQTDTWTSADLDGSRHGAASMDFGGAPMRMSGRLELQADGGGTREVFAIKIRSSVPFVGSRLESLVHDQVSRALVVDQRVGREWLSR